MLNFITTDYVWFANDCHFTNNSAINLQINYFSDLFSNYSTFALNYYFNLLTSTMVTTMANWYFLNFVKNCFTNFTELNLIVFKNVDYCCLYSSY